MSLHLSRRLALLAAASLVVAGCSDYATLSRRSPQDRAATGAGKVISQAMKHPAATPEAQMGRYLDAASASAEVLRKNPGDTQARDDYNFAASRLFEVLHERGEGIQPWSKPVVCPSADGSAWSFSMTDDG